ncbi:thiol:disulfide interchange protein DsbA/DsbL [Pseudomaricurvus alkylphenolicus]|jgi:thiol:disulfide interchange protein DsbA|uniref:thiol:disulfide interchange protein DsbA/DsbL n=1 Tax=Pseudomaricurvus alkylphenolicus TaxID=1306991 RepID=UPI0014242E1E|nr:thiol:disulfide interchange protein DsbA/DsbL [Pseudomaricurvus alkylphenolicus]NIB39541.1 thiol:disulfide interchange protein DsbA/DsbL [Pseudomaricurvus alkylphenolicus]
MRVLAAIFALMFSLMACAEGPASNSGFQEGKHYVVLDNPVRTRNPNKIEVTEVFWYGCGHCFRFEPMVHQWQKQQGTDVDFQQSPAMWNNDMEIHARAFYTAKALGVLDKVHQPLFNALNLERKKLSNIDALADFFAAQGVDRSKFVKAFNSFGVTSQVKQADARARSYKITGTPEMVVNGQYRISARMAGGQQQMLKVADYLIAKIRAEKS